MNGWQGAKDGAGRKAQAQGIPSSLLSTARVPELHGCSTVAGCVDLLGEFDTSEAGEEDSTRLHVPSGTALRVGAATTLQAVEDYVAPYAASSSTATALLSAISNFGWGGHQLRAAATLGGSVCFAPSYSVPQLTNFNPLFLCRFFHRFPPFFARFLRWCQETGKRKQTAEKRRKTGEKQPRNSGAKSGVGRRISSPSSAR